MNNFWIESRVINPSSEKEKYLYLYLLPWWQFHLIKEKTYIQFSIWTLFTLNYYLYCQEMVEKEGKGTVPCPLELSDHIEVISESVSDSQVHLLDFGPT